MDLQQHGKQVSVSIVYSKEAGTIMLRHHACLPFHLAMVLDARIFNKS